MGSGIVELSMLAKHDSVLIDRSKADAEKGLARIARDFDRAVSKGLLTPEQKADLMSIVRASDNIRDAKGANMMIEAVPEDLNLKLWILGELDRLAERKSIVATNTSSISINLLSKGLGNPESFIGLHFFNPPTVMKLIEMIKGDKTSQDTVDKSREFGESLGKTVVEVKDCAGFVSNRLLTIYLSEALHLLEQGIATKEAIDTIAKLGFNHPMGPFELVDFVGLDVCKDVMNMVYVQSKDPAFKPSPILERLVKEGRLGRKSGKGFYDY